MWVIHYDSCALNYVPVVYFVYCTLDKDDLFIIDQHASDEKCNYEKFMSQDSKIDIIKITLSMVVNLLTPAHTVLHGIARYDVKGNNTPSTVNDDKSDII